jgi:glycosyltransferase involved in cell wall biosynthesis
MASEHASGEVVPSAEDDQAQAEAVVRHIVQKEYQVVVIDVLGGHLQTNLARYLPPEIIRIMVVHSITPGTYAQALAVRDYVHEVVGVSPRIADDLVGRCGFSPDRTRAIPHGIDTGAFDAIQREEAPEELRLISLGRVEDAAKGVFWLPDILNALAPVRARLTVAGEGPDLVELKRLSERCSLPVDYVGEVAWGDVPALLARHDILLMPSRFEGFGLTIAEAMAAGCVPVVSRLRGVTDFIVEEGRTGCLFPVGDTAVAAESVRRLAEDRTMLRRLSVQGRQTVRQRFSREQMASAYAAMIRDCVANPPAICRPLDLANWSYPRGLRGSWRSHLPTGLKNFLRKWKERIR